MLMRRNFNGSSRHSSLMGLVGFIYHIPKICWLFGEGWIRVGVLGFNDMIPSAIWSSIWKERNWRLFLGKAMSYQELILFCFFWNFYIVWVTYWKKIGFFGPIGYAMHVESMDGFCNFVIALFVHGWSLGVILIWSFYYQKKREIKSL